MNIKANEFSYTPKEPLDSYIDSLFSCPNCGIELYGNNVSYVSDSLESGKGVCPKCGMKGSVLFRVPELFRDGDDDNLVEVARQAYTFIYSTFQYGSASMPENGIYTLVGEMSIVLKACRPDLPQIEMSFPRLKSWNLGLPEKHLNRIVTIFQEVFAGDMTLSKGDCNVFSLYPINKPSIHFTRTVENKDEGKGVSIPRGWWYV